MFKIKVCFRLRKDLYEMIKVLAKNNGKSIQDMIEGLLKIGYVRYVEGGIGNETNER